MRKRFRQQVTFFRVEGEGFFKKEAWCAPWTVTGTKNTDMKDKDFTGRE